MTITAFPRSIHTWLVASINWRIIITFFTFTSDKYGGSLAANRAGTSLWGADYLAIATRAFSSDEDICIFCTISTVTSVMTSSAIVAPAV